MYKGQERTLDFIEAILGGQAHEIYGHVASMTPAYFNELRNNLPHVAYFVRQLERDTKAVWIERNTNYEKLVKAPRRHFNDVDIAILELLHGNDEAAYYYRGLLNHVEDELTKGRGDQISTDATKLAVIRKSVRLLKRRGLVVHALGLFGDDGTAGSGFMENERRSETVEQIINNYRAEQGELGLTNG